jgi:hypothetical protein
MPPSQNASEPPERSFDGFAATRTEVLGLIGGASQTIRIVTDFLSDGEIASALYIAQYRKVSTQVLLGPGRATNVLSRLNFLKSQNIQVWLRPRNFMANYPTLILVDSTLYGLNAELDYQAKHRKFTLTRLPASSVKPFEDGFQIAANTGISPNPKPTPLVGRPGAQSRRRGNAAYQPSRLNSPMSSPLESTDGNVGGDARNPNAPYRYGRNKDKPASGVPTKLPKSTILQDRSKKQEQDPSVEQSY